MMARTNTSPNQSTSSVYVERPDFRILRRRPRQTAQTRAFQRLDRVVITLMLACFTLAHLRKDWGIAEYFNTVKWAGFLAFLGYSVMRNCRRFRIPRSTVCVLFLCMPVAGMISSFTNAFSLDEAAQRVFSFFALFCIAFLVPVPFDPRERIRVWLMSACDVCGGIVLVSAVLAFSPHFYGGGRFYGCIYHPNYLAAYASIAAIGRFPGLVKSLPRIRPVSLTITAAALYCLVATGARADLLATAAALGLVLIHMVSRRNALIVIAAMGMVAIGLAYGRDLINQFSPAQIKSRELRMSDRTGIWQKQLVTFLDKPWFGWGLELQGQTTSYGRLGAEGSYTELLSAVGLFGSFPFLAGTFLSLFRFHQLLARREIGEAVDPYVAGGFGVACYVMIVCVAEGYLVTVGTLIPITLWVVLAAGVGVRRGARKGGWRDTRAEGPAPPVDHVDIGRHRQF